MAYNKAKEEMKWRIWKQTEEKMLRDLGISEDKIAKLHEHDWAAFNSDRRYYQRLQSMGTYLYGAEASQQEIEMKTVDTLLDNIANEELYQVLTKLNKQTLEALLLKIQGFSVNEISGIVGLNEQTVYKRLNRLKKKIKKIFD